ncbi:outer membrane receptor for ferrienterochelin and colicins [Mucilaginibacter gracilis]|uniref:Outer membrane receptor for ferrienterochelin and colicins n=1 Tax=Mucilaginibacter gracilis TaxID=423350 RepID=A0A495JAN0_9SPHI|nr:TonB-dependent receptor [Mucilaginibacter gracilis]RKR85119.1 outer membrane receptor for ferrienterochelin and colicins [Mucilaginibacter gracilis]
MQIKYILYVLAMPLTIQMVFAQRHDPLKKDTTNTKQLKEVVVTGTRTAKSLQQVPIPITRITAEEIRKKGLVRLNEVLSEQTGMTILDDPHGQGIQIQGFDPAYTMILIDGLPIIGRNTGILELSRITTNNIERIEIVKGPTSSLYGSEAMAGVVNIITADPEKGVSGGTSIRYGTNKTADVSLNSAYQNDKFSISGFANRYSSGGYTLNSSSGLPTVSPFAGYTLNVKSSYKIDHLTTIKLSVRYYTNDQDSRYLVSGRYAGGTGTERDFNFAPVITHHFSDQLFSTLQLYRSTYKTNSDVRYEDDRSVYDQTYFNQAFNRAELQNDYTVKDNLKLTAGAGAQYETVEATRYTQLQSFTSGYGYVQADWLPIKRLDIIAGGRYDLHSVYKSQFSPKLAASYAVNNKLTLLASVGKGYKAPDFRQLYLNFTNAEVGYSVFGYEEAAAGIQRLQQQGQIQSVLIDPASLQRLNAESSTAFNLGYRYRPTTKIYCTANLFRNNITNLIETASIAIKTNGQSVYSYFNLNKVYTQGIETDLSYQVFKPLQLAGGFQYLEAYDQDVLNQIAAGKVFTKDAATNLTKLIKSSDYGGLLGRSKYTYNVRVNYLDQKTGINAAIRAIYRGRYGYKDSDGNGIVNRDDEYTKGYVLVNASLSKPMFKEAIRLQLTAQNLLNYKDTQVILNLPGRLIYAGIAYNFSKK